MTLTQNAPHTIIILFGLGLIMLLFPITLWLYRKLNCTRRKKTDGSD